MGFIWYLSQCGNLSLNREIDNGESAIGQARQIHVKAILTRFENHVKNVCCKSCIPKLMPLNSHMSAWCFAIGFFHKLGQLRTLRGLAELAL